MGIGVGLIEGTGVVGVGGVVSSFCFVVRSTRKGVSVRGEGRFVGRLVGCVAFEFSLEFWFVFVFVIE